MVIVEVKDPHGKLIEHQEFSIYAAAVDWFEWAIEAYGHSVSIIFGGRDAVVR